MWIFQSGLDFQLSLSLNCINGQSFETLGPDAQQVYTYFADLN